jgi:formylglycine-generating enzyme required for sulfatase activity
VDLQLAQAAAGPKAGEERAVEIANGVKVVFCYIPAGEAQLGSPKAERDAVRKAINKEEEPEWLSLEAEDNRGKFQTKGFWLGKYEVTQGEWEKVMGKNPSAFSPSGGGKEKVKGLDTSRYPVESVSWDMICGRNSQGGENTFLGRVNARRGAAGEVLGQGRFCLPHEDEWEYAYRGGKGNKQAFYWGDSLDGTQANFDGGNPFGGGVKGLDYLKQPCAVEFTNGGKYEKHPWGLTHMAGNVREWCANEHEQSNKLPLRGGAFSVAGLYCRGAHRSSIEPVFLSVDSGFRLCFRLD